MKKLFSIPNQKKDFEGYMLFVATIVWAIAIGIIASLGIYRFPLMWQRLLMFPIASILLAFVNLSISRFGYTRFAGWSLTTMIWLYFTAQCHSSGGIYASGVVSQVCIILTASILLGRRGGLLFGLLTVAADWGLVYLELNGTLPQPSLVHNPTSRWIEAIVPMGTILVLQYYATNHLIISLQALRSEARKREHAEKLKGETLHSLGERVKELQTLYTVGRILQDQELSLEHMFQKIADAIPPGWQYPDITAACVRVDNTEHPTANYKPVSFSQVAEMTTINGTEVSIEVAYLEEMPEIDEGPFLKEERNLINMLVEILARELGRRESTSEIRDYKYAIDIASLVSVSGVDGKFTFVNDNFCKVTKYSSKELIGQHHELLWSGHHSPGFFDDLQRSMTTGKPYRGELCLKAKDGSQYWVDSTIVPFLDDLGDVYQYLSIQHDITRRKVAADKIRESEELLRKITSLVPGNTYMFEIFENGKFNILFMNRGTDTYNHIYDFEELSVQPEKLLEIIHEEGKSILTDALVKAYNLQTPISFQYRVVIDGKTRWRWMQAVPEKGKNGNMYCYGSTSDITSLVDYTTSIEQIIFDIGHVIRRPISSMLGLTALILEDGLSKEEIKEISKKLHEISLEMDNFIRELNTAYEEKRETAAFNIDFSSSINERSTLFK